MAFKVYKDNNEYKLPTKTIRTHYKYVNWTQPILASNGTLGGNKFAVASNVQQLSPANVYMLFIATNGTSDCFHSTQNVTTGEIYLYNPNPLKITNIKVTNQNAPGSANRASSKGGIYGLGENGWELIKSYTNSVQSINGTWNIDLSSNTKGYKYYMMKSTANGGNDYWSMGKLNLTAKEILASTETDYDFYTDKFTYYGIGG